MRVRRRGLIAQTRQGGTASAALRVQEPPFTGQIKTRR